MTLPVSITARWPPEAKGWRTRGGGQGVRELTSGTAAGAVGTVALKATTCAAMVVRGRPASSVPAQVAAMSSKRGRGPTCPERAKAGSKDNTAQTRRSGSGALSGYVGGLGVGTGCGLIRPSLGSGSKLRAGVVLALAVMAGSGGPATALGGADPRDWSLNSWIYDTNPHLAYGLTTAVARDALIS